MEQVLSTDPKKFQNLDRFQKETKMRTLVSLVLLLVGTSEIFAEDRLISLESDSKSAERNSVKTVLIFDGDAGLLHHSNVDHLGKVSTRMGEYQFEKGKLRVTWLNNGSIEEATLNKIESDRVEYRVLKDSGSRDRVGTVVTMRRGVIPEAAAISTIRFGDFYIEAKRRRIESDIRDGKAWMQMQHEFNMKLLESSKAFGESLGFPTIK
jgi:hypothetical protein